MTMDHETLRSDVFPPDRYGGTRLFLNYYHTDGGYRVESRWQTFKRFRQYMPASAYFDDLLLSEPPPKTTDDILPQRAQPL
jgi:hypothetical protein